MKTAIIAIICFLVIASGTFLVKGSFYYGGTYHPPAPSQRVLGSVATPTSNESALVEPIGKRPGKQSGTLVVDLAHHNNFSPWEIDTLLAQVAARGYSVKFVKESKDLPQTLRAADAYIIISPQTEISRTEISLIQQAVKRNMKLLLIEEPARSRASYSGTRNTLIPANDLSAAFGFLFERDYLYNLTENEGNYRNVYFTEFKPSPITKGLRKITLYSAGSLSGSMDGIVYTGTNVTSSKIETKGKLSPMVLTADSHVLGIYNLTFLTEPYNTSNDNGRLLVNIADWLADSDRNFTLADFPYFLHDGAVVTYSDATLLSQAVAVKNLLAGYGLTFSIGNAEHGKTTPAGDMAFVGLFDKVDQIKTALDAGKIKIMATDIEIAGIGTVPQTGTALVYLDKHGESNRLVILADSAKQLKDIIQIVKDDKLRDWLVNDSLAIYRVDDKK